MLKNSREKGIVGEEIAIKYLIKKGYTIVGRNYQRKCGEIDIVAKKSNTIHFFEVKSTIVKDLKDNSQRINSMRPEENVHSRKISRLRKIVQMYLFEKESGFNTPFFVGVIIVRYEEISRKAKVAMIDIVL